MISITASGRLAFQPELKIGKQTSFCEFRLLAIRYAKGEEHTEAVTFFCYGDDAERFCEMAERGQFVEATGTQETQHWTDAGGQQRSAAKYKLTWWQAGPRPRRSHQPAAAPRGRAAAQPAELCAAQDPKSRGPEREASGAGNNSDEPGQDAGLI